MFVGRAADVCGPLQVGVAGPEADERDVQFVAEKTQQVQEFALLARGRAEQIVGLVDDQQAHADRAHQSQGDGLAEIGATVESDRRPQRDQEFEV